jgi:DNA-binding transcriptional regulator YhcF (GntR family)
MHYVFDSGAWERLTKNELRVYLQICKHYNLKEHRSYPSINTLAEEVSVSRLAVIRAIKKLKDEGLVVVKQERLGKSFKCNIYQIPDYLLREIDNKKDVVSKEILGSIIKSLGGINSDQDKHITYITNIYNSVISNNKRTSLVSNEPLRRPKDVFMGISKDERTELQAKGLL